MLKKFFLVVAVMAITVSSFAGDWGVAGCGLGGMLVKKNEVLPQLGASILNDLISPQTFAITSGTSGCVEGTGKQVSKFVSVNRVALITDISRGQGETLVGLSEIIGCKNSANLSHVLKTNFNVIFPAGNTPSEEVTGNIYKSIKDNSTLKNCKSLS